MVYQVIHIPTVRVVLEFSIGARAGAAPLPALAEFHSASADLSSDSDKER
jgi:hypothetical protein